MKRLLFIMLLAGHLAHGQTNTNTTAIITANNIISDTLNTSSNKTFNNKIKLTQIDQSKAKIDIRLYTLHSLSNTTSMRRLFLIDSSWAAVEFDEWNNPVKIVNYRLMPSISFDSIFNELLVNNVLTLPNQSELKNRMQKIEVTPDGDTMLHQMMVLDGEGYTIEFKINDKFRVYRFNNPESYADFYNDVSELKNYLNIVQVFDKQLMQTSSH